MMQPRNFSSYSVLVGQTYYIFSLIVSIATSRYIFTDVLQNVVDQSIVLRNSLSLANLSTNR